MEEWKETWTWNVTLLRVVFWEQSRADAKSILPCLSLEVRIQQDKVWVQGNLEGLFFLVLSIFAVEKYDAHLTLISQCGSTHRIVLYPASMWCQDGQIVTGTWTLTVRVPKLGIWIPLEIYFLEENGDSQLIVRHMHVRSMEGCPLTHPILKILGSEDGTQYRGGFQSRELLETVSYNFSEWFSCCNTCIVFRWFWRIHYWILGIFSSRAPFSPQKAKWRSKIFWDNPLPSIFCHIQRWTPIPQYEWRLHCKVKSHVVMLPGLLVKVGVMTLGAIWNQVYFPR